MTYAFVINGFAEHGIVRATSCLAAALSRISDVKILSTQSETPSMEDYTAFQDAICDGVLVMHASHRTNYVWGKPECRIETLVSFLKNAKFPVVIYLHDIYEAKIVRGIIEKILSAVPFIRTWKKISYERRFMNAIGPYVNRYIVSNECERKRLGKYTSSKKIALLPHFVEERTAPCSREEAKIHIGLGGKKIITVLGFIVPRKGHDTAISVLAHLPENMHMVFAGKGEDGYIYSLRNKAGVLGVNNRLHITGYLTEGDLDMYLAASDVAFCPFKEVSASGSLTTWLATGKPIVAHDLPLMRYYKDIFPDHIHLVRQDDLKGCAEIIQKLVSCPPAGVAKNIDQFSIDNTAKNLLAILEDVRGTA